MYARLTLEEKIEFEKRYPGAYAYLVHHDLVHELEELRREYANNAWFHPGRKQWVEERIADLANCLEH